MSAIFSYGNVPSHPYFYIKLVNWICISIPFYPIPSMEDLELWQNHWRRVKSLCYFLKIQIRSPPFCCALRTSGTTPEDLYSFVPYFEISACWLIMRLNLFMMISFAMTNNREHTRKNVERFVIIDYAIFSKKKIEEIAKIANVENLLLLYIALSYHIFLY